MSPNRWRWIRQKAREILRDNVPLTAVERSLRLRIAVTVAANEYTWLFGSGGPAPKGLLHAAREAAKR